MQRHHCGIDLGSTNIKTVLIDEEGRSLCSRSMPTPRISDGSGVLTDALHLVTLLEGMILACRRELGASAPLRSITVAGVGEDGLGLGSDLAPFGHSIPWFDRRAEPEAAFLRRTFGGDARAGISIASDRTVAKWLWLQRHRPEELKEARHWVALTDFPAVWWTGRPFMSDTLAARTACFDVYGRQWIGDLLDEVHAPALPPLLRAGDPVGSVTRGELVRQGAVSAETKVVAGGHDHPIAALCIRASQPLARVDSMGTANLVYSEATGPSPPSLDPYIAFSIPPRSEVGVSCLGVYELSMALTQAGADRDMLDRMLRERRLAGVPLPCRQDGEVAAIRARLEDAAFYARRMFEAMDDADAPPGPIFATGGWAGSPAFLELRASIFGKPIYLIDEPELTAVGAACLGIAACTGEAPDIRSTGAIRQIDPVDEWAAIYAQAYPAIRRSLDASRLSE